MMPFTVDLNYTSPARAQRSFTVAIPTFAQILLVSATTFAEPSPPPTQPVIVDLQPQTLKQTLTGMAQQLADAIASRNLSKVGVLEFTNHTQVGELLGRDYGLLGKYCAEYLEEQLVRQQQDHFQVVNRRKLQRALQEQQFALADLGSLDALESLSDKTGGMPVIAVGILHDRSGRKLKLRCKLIETANSDVATVVEGNAWLNQSEWAMLGKSVAIPIEDRRPEIATDGKPARPIEDVIVDRMDARSNGPHPLSDPEFPFRIWITVNGQTREGEFRGNDYYVPMRKGEQYEIQLENRSGHLSMLRLLVDGLNTLPEAKSSTTSEDPAREESPVLTPELATENGIFSEVFRKHENLNDARWWILDPKVSVKNRYAIRGWVTRMRGNGDVRPFKIIDATESLATRRKFTAQMGLITAAFYAAKRPRLPDFTTHETRELRKYEIGDLMGVVHICYYDPDEPQPPNP